MRRVVIPLAAAAALALALAGCGGSDASAGGVTKLKIGYPSDVAQYADLYVCEQEGIFKKHGLDVDLTLLNTSSQLLAALASNSVQVTGGDGQAIAAGALKGAKVKMIELGIPVYFTEVWAPKSVTSMTDLEGKKVGVTAAGSVTDRATRLMLDDMGLDAKVQVVNFSSLSALESAAQNGSVDALVSGPPASAMTGKNGWHKVGDMTHYKAAAEVYTVTSGFAAEHRDEVAKFVAADTECMSFLQNPKNRAASIKAIVKYSQTDQDLATYSYNFYRNVWNYKPVVDESLVRLTFQRAAQSDEVPDVSSFIDNSFVREALSKAVGK
jgi:NitT/TauT family transport system substrate-binding protein